LLPILYRPADLGLLALLLFTSTTEKGCPNQGTSGNAPNNAAQVHALVYKILNTKRPKPVPKSIPQPDCTPENLEKTRGTPSFDDLPCTSR